MNEYNFKIENYEGPLDLLLSLVKDKKKDILEINLSELSTEYLKIISKLKDVDLDLASDYLVMASNLLNIKSKKLLENPEEKKAIQKDEEDILKKLVEYQQFKKIALELRKKEEERKKIYIKDEEDTSDYEQDRDKSKLDGNSDPIQLIKTMRKMFERVHANKLRTTKIEKFDLSPSERRLEILEILKAKNEPTFNDIFNVPTMNHFVITMLTILDMARNQELILTQKEQFTNILFKKGVIND